MSQFLTSGGQSTGVSASASVLPMSKFLEHGISHPPAYMPHKRPILINHLSTTLLLLNSSLQRHFMVSIALRNYSEEVGREARILVILVEELLTILHTSQ